jgi:acyl carrier protein
MSEIRTKLMQIIAEFANVEPAALVDCKTIADLPLDSIGMLGVFDEVEEVYEVKVEGITPETSLDEFEAVLTRLVAAKNA